MRDYGRVFSAFWQSPETRAYSEDGRTLALYLLTSPHANLIGCYRLTDAYAADDMQWSLERVREGFSELQEKGFATRDEGTKWVLIHKYLKWNSFENGNVAIAAHKAFDHVPATPLKALLAVALLEFGCHLKEPFANALQTLRESFANPEPDPEPILIQNPTRTISASAAVAKAPSKKARGEYPEEFEAAWQAYPDRPGKSKADAHKAWAARLRDGADAEAVLAGVKRYAAYCAACITDPNYVKQPTTFFGPGQHYEADWTPPMPRSVESPRERAARERMQQFAPGVAAKAPGSTNVIELEALDVTPRRVG
jgi:hypothetical protein